VAGHEELPLKLPQGVIPELPPEPTAMVLSGGYNVMHMLHGQVASFAHNRKEAAAQALTQAEALITFLRGHGALLGGLKPELLLELEDFRHDLFPTLPLVSSVCL
jgi:hypothetical protein